MGLKMFRKICRDLILICIDHIRLRMLLQCRRDLIQCIGGQQIIMIQKCDKITLCHGKSRVCIFCNAKIFFQILIADPPVHLCIGFQHSLHVRILRASVCQTQLPVLICLCKERVQHLS